MDITVNQLGIARAVAGRWSGKSKIRFDELLSEANWHLVRAVERYKPKPDANINTYIYCFVNRSIGRFCHRYRKPSQVEIPDKPHEPTDEREEREHFEHLISPCNRQEKEVLLMHFYDGLRIHEIANALGMSRRHVHRIKNSGLERIKEDEELFS